MSRSFDAAAIAEAERELGARFPESFRRHLLDGKAREVTVLELEWELAAADVVAQTKEAREWPGFPSDGVAVGDDGSGNYLVFLPAERDPSVLLPELFVWWHEGSELESVGEFNTAITEDTTATPLAETQPRRSAGRLREEVQGQDLRAMVLAAVSVASGLLSYLAAQSGWGRRDAMFGLLGLSLFAAAQAVRKTWHRRATLRRIAALEARDLRS